MMKLTKAPVDVQVEVKESGKMSGGDKVLTVVDPETIGLKAGCRMGDYVDLLLRMMHELKADG